MREVEPPRRDDAPAAQALDTPPPEPEPEPEPEPAPEVAEAPPEPQPEPLPEPPVERAEPQERTAAVETAPPPVAKPEPRREPPRKAPVRKAQRKPVKKAAPAAAPSEAREGDSDVDVAGQTAAGAGGGADAGAGSSEAATLSKGEAEKLMLVWGAKIRSDVARSQRSPRGGRRSGQVIVALTVTRDGGLMSHRLQRGSGDRRLDTAALQAVTDAAPFPAAPDGLNGASYSFLLPIHFK